MPDDKRAAARAHLSYELGFSEDGTQRGVASADSLCADDQIGNDAPVIQSPSPAGAPEPGHHLVGDEEDAVAVTDLTDALEIPQCGGNSAEGSANHKLGDESSGIVGAQLTERVLQLVGAGEVTLWTGPVRTAAIRVAWRDVFGGWQDRGERPATRCVPAKRERGDRRAVERRAAPDH